MKTPALIPFPARLVMENGVAPVTVPVTRTADSSLPAEGYRLRITAEAVTMSASGSTGFSRAQATLAQLSHLYPDALPCLTIEDAPAREHRAFLLDTARHFFPADEIKKMIHAASAFKLNRFHWVFENDQGWRIESRRFPLLHKIGAWRGADITGNYRHIGREGGYYTQEEVRDIVRTANACSVEVIPELDLPGHVLSILAAYPQYSCTGKPQKVAETPGIFPDILCAGKEEVFTFLDDLIGELVTLFPGPYFHMGGDEAPKDRWKVCPACQARLKAEHLRDEASLQAWFGNRVAKVLARYGRTPIAWNEAAEGDALDASVILQLWTGNSDVHTERHVAKGGRVIYSPVGSCYCDYPYGALPLKTIYEVPLSTETLPAGSVIGTECLLWTEHVRTAGQLEKLAWPRFAALAEAAWCGDGRPGYPDFEERLRLLLPYLDGLGVAYRRPEEDWNPSGPEAVAETAAFRASFRAG